MKICASCYQKQYKKGKDSSKSNYRLQPTLTKRILFTPIISHLGQINPVLCSNPILLFRFLSYPNSMSSTERKCKYMIRNVYQVKSAFKQYSSNQHHYYRQKTIDNNDGNLLDFRKQSTSKLKHVRQQPYKSSRNGTIIQNRGEQISGIKYRQFRKDDPIQQLSVNKSRNYHISMQNQQVAHSRAKSQFPKTKFLQGISKHPE